MMAMHVWVVVWLIAAKLHSQTTKDTFDRTLRYPLRLAGPGSLRRALFECNATFNQKSHADPTGYRDARRDTTHIYPEQGYT